MKHTDFIPGEIYYFDYAKGYLMRFKETKNGDICTLSSKATEAPKVCGPTNGWAHTGLIGKGTRLATEKERREYILQEKAAKIKIPQIYEKEEESYSIY